MLNRHRIVAWAVAAQFMLALAACGGGGGGSDDDGDSSNGVPRAADDSATAEGSAVSINVLANDSFGADGRGDTAIEIVAAPANGTATVDEGDSPGDPIDDVIVYTPNPGFSGSDSFRYRIEDADGDRDTATVEVLVDSGGGTNGTPTAVNDSLTIDENDPTTNVPVVGNDSFGGDGPSSSPISIVSGPSNGTASVDDNGTPGDPTDDSIDYTPDTDFAGSDSLTYEIEDADGDQDTATVSVTVNPADDTPTAVGDSVTTEEDTTAAGIDVLDNDDFGNDGPSSSAIVVTTDGLNGSATVDDNGTPNDPTDDTIGYVPDADFSGSDTFDYRIEDADGDRDTATVSVTVTENTPTAADDSLTIDENDPTTNIPVVDNDSFGGDGPSSSPISIVSGPSNGTASVDDNGTPGDPTDDSIDYTPDTDFAGSDSLAYEIEDADGDTDTATVDVTVNPAGSGDVVYIKASNTASGDRFGGSLDTSSLNEDNFGGDSVSLSADGDTLVVGAPGHATAAGRVYVFVRDGSGNWSEQATFQGVNTGATDRFGATVALSGDGNTLAVGAPLEDNGASTLPEGSFLLNAGAAYVFTRSGGSWSQQGYIKPSSPAEEEAFGTSVALSENGDILAVGAMGNDGGSSQAGAAYLFTRGGSTWTERDTVVSTTPENNDLLGYRVALSADGRTLAVGAVQDGASQRPTGAGAVHVFTDGNADDDWDFLQEVHAPSPSAGAKFGASVALSDSGDRLAAGAHAEDGRGEAHVFLLSGGAYGLEASLVASNADSLDRFGASVALSAAGDLLVVGAPREDSSARGIDGNEGNDSATDAGAAYLFSRSGTWSQMNYVKASNTDANDFFGESAALSDDGGVLAIGAGGEASNATGIDGNEDNDSANNSGAVYLY